MLQIIFKDGETRNINVSPLFFVQDKMSRETTEHKCYALAHDFGGTIFKMTLGDNVIRENVAFNPDENNGLQVVENYKEKRRLRNLHKNDKFEMKINITTGTNTNLKTGVKMYANAIAA